MDSKVLEQLQEVLSLLHAVRSESSKECYDTVVTETLMNEAVSRLNNIIDAEMRFDEDFPF